MKRHSPTRRSLAVYAAACALLFVLLAPALLACVPTTSANACGCCTHAHSTPNSACCTASHIPAALPATLGTASHTAQTISAYRVPFALLVRLSANIAEIRIASPPGTIPLPLRI